MRLAAALCACLLSAGAARAGDVVPIDVAATAIDRFDAGTPVGSHYGKLVFLGGLQLRSRDPDFGGLSGLRLSADGGRFTAISDRGNWFTGALTYDDGRLSGVSGVTRGPTPGRDGRPLPGRRGFDTESLEIQGRTAWTAAERVNWLTRYTLDEDGRPDGKGVAVEIPPAARKAPFNEGYEAMAALSSGAILIVAEKYLDDDGDNHAFAIGAKPFSFSVRRTDDFSPTDMARLPDGGFVLLERRYKPPFSLAVRIRRLAEAEIKAGATVDGPVLMQATLAQTIDNFECISAHRNAAGATVLTVLSDDNFSFFERTLMMQFALPD